MLQNEQHFPFTVLLPCTKKKIKYLRQVYITQLNILFLVYA